MREYKREKDALESHLREVQKKAVDHDDQIRVINALWDQVHYFRTSYSSAPAKIFSQLLDEVKLLVEDEIPSQDDIEGQSSDRIPESRLTKVQQLFLPQQVS